MNYKKILTIEINSINTDLPILFFFIQRVVISFHKFKTATEYDKYIESVILNFSYVEKDDYRIMSIDNNKALVDCEKLINVANENIIVNEVIEYYNLTFLPLIKIMEYNSRECRGGTGTVGDIVVVQTLIENLSKHIDVKFQ